MSDIIRIMRIIEYVGTREKVEETINKSIHGTKFFSDDLQISVSTIGSFPEILKKENN